MKQISIRVEEVALIPNQLRFVNEDMGINERFDKEDLLAKKIEYKKLGEENNMDVVFIR